MKTFLRSLHLSGVDQRGGGEGDGVGGDGAHHV